MYGQSPYGGTPYSSETIEQAKATRLADERDAEKKRGNARDHGNKVDVPKEDIALAKAAESGEGDDA